MMNSYIFKMVSVVQNDSSPQANWVWTLPEVEALYIVKTAVDIWNTTLATLVEDVHFKHMAGHQPVKNSVLYIFAIAFNT